MNFNRWVEFYMVMNDLQHQPWLPQPREHPGTLHGPPLPNWLHPKGPPCPPQPPRYKSGPYSGYNGPGRHPQGRGQSKRLSSNPTGQSYGEPRKHLLLFWNFFTFFGRWFLLLSLILVPSAGSLSFPELTACTFWLMSSASLRLLFRVLSVCSRATVTPTKHRLKTFK